jgi:hypothetical protein
MPNDRRPKRECTKIPIATAAEYERALADIASAAPGALELRDPLAQFDPDIANRCHRLARELNDDCTMSQLHYDTLTISIGVQLVRRWSNRGTKVTPFRGGLPPARLRRVEEFSGFIVGRPLVIHFLHRC